MRRYQGKRDPWAVILLSVTVAPCLAAIPALIASSAGAIVKSSLFVVIIGAAVFALLLLIRTHYDLGDGRLRVRHGLLRWVIPVRGIRAVSRVHGFAASAALSSDRIRVEYGRGRAYIEIAPADTAAFLNDLRAMSPGIRVH
jgi:hypothetical protein